MEINKILEAIPEDEFDRLIAEKKWQRIFKADLPGIYNLVSKFLSIPASNACVERIFSLCTAQWTDVRNSLNIDTVKSLAQVKVNYDLSCPEMYNMLLSNAKLIREICEGEKYH